MFQSKPEDLLNL